MNGSPDSLHLAIGCLTFRQVSKWPPLRPDPRRALRDSVKSITLDVESENVGRIQIAVVIPQPWLQLT